MPSSDLGSIDLQDTDTGHTNGSHGHDVLNDWIDIATRPASVRTIAHNANGALSINVDAVSGGHTARVTVGANITGLTITNMTTGLPFLLLLEGNGTGSFTADLSGIRINSITPLSSSVVVNASSVLAVCFIKTKDNILWAPAGILSYGAVSSSGITLVGTTSLPFTNTFGTSKTFTIPTGVLAGDLIEIITATQEPTNQGAPITPGDYIARWSVGGGAPYMPTLSKIYRIAAGSEAGTTKIISWSSSNSAHGGVQVWRGVDTSFPYDNSASSVATGNFSNPNANSVNSITSGALGVISVAGNINGGTTCTPPTAYTKAIDQSVGLDRSVITAYKNLLTVGAEDPAAFGWSVENWTIMLDILRKGT
jgi:hypothetical protein